MMAQGYTKSAYQDELDSNDSNDNHLTNSIDRSKRKRSKPSYNYDSDDSNNSSQNEASGSDDEEFDRKISKKTGKNQSKTIKREVKQEYGADNISESDSESESQSSTNSDSSNSFQMKKPIKQKQKNSVKQKLTPVNNSFDTLKTTSKKSENSILPPKKKKIKSEQASSDEDLIIKKSSKKSKILSGTKISTKSEPTKMKTKPEASPSPMKSKSKSKVKKEEEKEEVWKWWEEKPLPEGIRWRTLEHKGPHFPPPYTPLPSYVKFLYNNEAIKLSASAEEVAGFYSVMLNHDYTKKDIFNHNFFEDWQKEMKFDERRVITKLEKCDFSQFAKYYEDQREKKKSMTKEEKLEIKESNAKIQEEYGFCLVDGHKQKIGNFRIEPPGLFRGRGEHPKQGKLKKLVQPEDVIINIGKHTKPPEAPSGHKWKAIQNDNTVSWLACWAENITGSNKYIMLNPTSRIKGEKDWQKYETARKLHQCVGKIRSLYQEDFKSREMIKRQRAVALYFIDKLALRAGNEKDADEEADTVGCCSLRVEHITLYDEYEGKENMVYFDFLGKDSIRYQNIVSVDKQVFKNLKLFMKDKESSDELFDRLNTGLLNKYLHELMEGLTAKVFRTYNASNTLQEQLNLMTNPKDSVHDLMLAYNRANRAVAVLCNHQRTVPKAFEKQMDNLKVKIQAKSELVKQLKKELKDAKKSKETESMRKTEIKIDKAKDMLHKLEVQATDKEENKQIALGTSKLNYLDPRISVSWCKKYDCGLEKIYNKTQREKFAWAIDMADDSFIF